MGGWRRVGPHGPKKWGFEGWGFEGWGPNPQKKEGLKDGGPKFGGIFKDVRFYPILNFGHFWASLAFDLPQCQQRWSIDFLESGGGPPKRRTRGNNTI